jgi:hypothetical protein
VPRHPDDSSELVIVFPTDATPLPPPRKRTEPPDPAALRRAHRHGVRARPHFPAWTFAEAEAELRAGWILNGETARWESVRDAVRQGFEGDAGAPG